MGKTGRPTKLTPEVQERIEQAIRVGVTHAQAAEYAVGATLREWMREIRRLRSLSTRARPRARSRCWRWSIMPHTHDWRAAAWILEHRWPEDYAVSRIDVHHSGEVQVNLDARMDLLAQVGAVLQQMFADQPQVLDEFAQRTAQLEPLPLPTTRNRKPRTTRKERE